MPALIRSDEAQADLAGIVAFMTGRNRSAALRLDDAIARATERLIEHPYLHRPGRMPGTREIVVHPHYTVIHRVGLGEVLVLPVLHARQRDP